MFSHKGPDINILDFVSGKLFVAALPLHYESIQGPHASEKQVGGQVCPASHLVASGFRGHMCIRTCYNLFQSHSNFIMVGLEISYNIAPCPPPIFC